MAWRHIEEGMLDFKECVDFSVKKEAGKIESD